MVRHVLLSALATAVAVVVLLQPAAAGPRASEAPALPGTPAVPDAGAASAAEPTPAPTARPRTRSHTRSTVTTDVHRVRRSEFRSPRVLPAPPKVRARAWTVADLDTGQVLVRHDQHRHLPEASTIKLLTALTAMRRVPALPSHRVSKQEANPASCTCAGLKVGARYTRTALMAGMLLPSGNDAAEALAGSDPAGHDAFVAAENRLAASLGARDTRVVTPSGLTARGAHSSAYDLLVFLRAAIADPTVTRVLGWSSYELGPRDGHKRHPVFRGTQYVARYPGSLGKSGYTTPARNTLVVETEIGGHHIGVATLGSPAGYSTAGARALTLWAVRHHAQLEPVGRLP